MEIDARRAWIESWLDRHGGRRELVDLICEANPTRKREHVESALNRAIREGRLSPKWASHVVIMDLRRGGADPVPIEIFGIESAPGAPWALGAHECMSAAIV